MGTKQRTLIAIYPNGILPKWTTCIACFAKQRTLTATYPTGILIQWNTCMKCFTMQSTLIMNYAGTYLQSKTKRICSMDLKEKSLILVKNIYFTFLCMFSGFFYVIR